MLFSQRHLLANACKYSKNISCKVHVYETHFSQKCGLNCYTRQNGSVSGLHYLSMSSVGNLKARRANLAALQSGETHKTRTAAAAAATVPDKNWLEALVQSTASYSDRLRPCSDRVSSVCKPCPHSREQGAARVVAVLSLRAALCDHTLARPVGREPVKSELRARRKLILFVSGFRC